MTRWHAGISARFALFPKHQQLLMALNELNRAQNMQNVPVEDKRALERCLELVDLMSAQPVWRPALYELRRGREMIARLYVAPAPLPTLSLQNALLQLDSTAWKMLKKTDRSFAK